MVASNRMLPGVLWWRWRRSKLPAAFLGRVAVPGAAHAAAREHGELTNVVRVVLHRRLGVGVSLVQERPDKASPGERELHPVGSESPPSHGWPARPRQTPAAADRNLVRATELSVSKRWDDITYS